MNNRALAQQERRALGGGVPGIALKEWALVCDLLVAGQQIALLRKGGIHEPHRGDFALEHDTFLLYPNAEHQSLPLVQPHYRHLLQAASPVPREDGEVIVPGYCRVTDAVPLTDPSRVHALAAQTCWTEAFFEQRLAYRPERPTLLVLVRAYRFPTPLRLPYHKTYAGCRSWVPLQESVDDATIATALPALDDHLYAARRRAALDAVGLLTPA
jgi:hypothetical protein